MIRRLWEHAGVTCDMRRCAFEAPCGYVLVPEGHPLHGAKYEEAESRLDVHGGVTFAGDFQGLGYSVGFDMAHACSTAGTRRPIWRAWWRTSPSRASAR